MSCSSAWRDSRPLYDAIAPEYDALVASGYRRAYDLLAGEYVTRLLPSRPGVIVDAGCGVGRWAAAWLARGHDVIGIEQAPQMIAQLRRRNPGPRFRLIEQSIAAAQIAAGSADLVVALGSFPYFADPAAALRRFAGWLKPGGQVCLYTDSLLALVLELIRIGRSDEALLRLRTRRGVFRYGRWAADLHLFDAAALRALLVDAGFDRIACHGLLVTASAYGKEQSARGLAADEAGFLDLERALMDDQAMADAGKHIIASGRRPP